MRPSRAFVHIIAVDAVTGVTGVACTRERSNRVGTRRSSMTVVRACSTLIHVVAVGDTVASVAGVAHTVVTSVGVGARRVVAAAVGPSGALVDIV